MRPHRNLSLIVRSVRGSSPSGRPIEARIPTGSTARFRPSDPSRARLSDRRARAGTEGCQSHRAPLPRRLCRRAALLAPCSRSGFARGHHDPADAGCPAACRLHDHQCRALRAAGQPSRPRARWLIAGSFCRRALPRCRDCAPILALGRIAHDGTLDALGLKRRGYHFRPRGPPRPSDRPACSSTAITARARTRIPDG